MLNRYELLVAKEESERVDTLRYSWQKLQSLAVNIYFSIFCLGNALHVIFKNLECLFFFFFSNLNNSSSISYN